MAYEVSYYLKRQKSTQKGNVAFKLDISKAYDKLEWRFVEGMLRPLGFCEGWIELMMLCVKSVQFNVLVNEELVGPIVLTKGLRQGDPLSPYLFILCAEGFFALINKYVQAWDLHGSKVARSAPIVSLFFFCE